jgi:hypothetical protein
MPQRRKGVFRYRTTNNGNPRVMNAIYPFGDIWRSFIFTYKRAEMHDKSAKMVERTTEKTQEGYALWQR